MDDDDLEITLRDPADVARRAIVLASLLRRLALEDVASTDVTDAQAEAFDLREWLREQDLSEAMTKVERAIIDCPPAGLSDPERIDASWRAESLAALCWSLGVLQLGSIGESAELDSALAAIPAPWDSTQIWINAARLMREENIALERERAELWHWRANVEALRRDASPSDRQEYNDAIRDVTADALTARLLDATRDNDFAVGRSPFRSLSAADLDRILAASTERLRALNWVSGFGTSWDDVPLEV